MNAIWRWKLLSYQLAQALIYPELSKKNFYRKIRRLLLEGYLLERDSGHLDTHVLQVSKKGFDFFQEDISRLRETRFAAQSVAHDYWATAFQIGEFLGEKTHVEFFTEQEVQCTEDSLLPDWVPKTREHIPDGFTRIVNDGVETVFAIEVELNLKPLLRYDKAGYYFDAGLSKVDIVFWLCDGKNITQRIFERLAAARLRNLGIHHFIFTDDYKKLGWDAVTRSGQFKGRSIREIYRERGYVGPGKGLGRSWEGGLREIFFSNTKSPWVPSTSLVSGAQPSS